MPTRLAVIPVTCRQTLTNVLDEIFADDQYNWGRVVTVYAFAGHLAKYCVDNGMTDSVEDVADCAGTYVAERLSDWIGKQGGWVGKSFGQYTFLVKFCVASKIFAVTMNILL